MPGPHIETSQQHCGQRACQRVNHCKVPMAISERQTGAVDALAHTGQQQPFPSGRQHGLQQQLRRHRRANPHTHNYCQHPQKCQRVLALAHLQVPPSMHYGGQHYQGKWKKRHVMGAAETLPGLCGTAGYGGLLSRCGDGRSIENALLEKEAGSLPAGCPPPAALPNARSWARA